MCRQASCVLLLLLLLPSLTNDERESHTMHHDHSSRSSNHQSCVVPIVPDVGGRSHFRSSDGAAAGPIMPSIWLIGLSALKHRRLQRAGTPEVQRSMLAVQVRESSEN